MIIKVYFKAVGRNNISFERICKDKLTYEWLIKQVRPHCMSENLDFTYNEKKQAKERFSEYFGKSANLN